MNVTAYLMVSSAGNVRVTKRSVGVRANELAIKVDLTIPDAFFKRPIPVVKIDVPKELIANPAAGIVLDITAETIAGALGVSVTDVRDGLDEAVKRAENDV